MTYSDKTNGCDNSLCTLSSSRIFGKVHLVHSLHICNAHAKVLLRWFVLVYVLLAQANRKVFSQIKKILVSVHSF